MRSTSALSDASGGRAGTERREGGGCSVTASPRCRYRAVIVEHSALFSADIFKLSAPTSRAKRSAAMIVPMVMWRMARVARE